MIAIPTKSGALAALCGLSIYTAITVTAVTLTGCAVDRVPPSWDPLRPEGGPRSDGTQWFHVPRGESRGLRLALRPQPPETLSTVSQGYSLERFVIQLRVVNASVSTIDLSPCHWPLEIPRGAVVPKSACEGDSSVLQLHVLPGESRTLDLTYEIEGDPNFATRESVDLRWSYTIDDTFHDRTTAIPIPREPGRH